MAAIASAPMPVTTSYDDIQYRRPQPRSSARPAVRRAYAQKRSPQPLRIQNLTTDSSDDEDLAPIKLSAEAQAILGEDNSQGGSAGRNDNHEDQTPGSEGGEAVREGVGRVQITRQSSTSPGRSDGSPAPRIVRVAATTRPTALTSIARDGSFMYKTVGKVEDRPYRVVTDARTPATRLKKVRVSGSRSNSHSPSSTESAVNSGDAKSTERTDAHQRDPDSPEGGGARDEPIPSGPSTIMRPRRADDNHPQSTARSAKRFGAGFKTRPIRSGMIRRQSEDDEAAEQRDRDEKSVSPEIQQGRRAQEPDLEDLPDDFGLQSRSPPRKNVPFRIVPSPPPPFSQATTRTKSPRLETEAHRSPSPQPVIVRSKTPHSSNGSAHSSKSSSAKLKPIFHIPSVPPLPSAHDQENEPEPTFKNVKSSSSMLGERPKTSIAPLPKHHELSRRASPSPQRQPLAARNGNTPHRPAPAPPPKMSMIEAATSNAGSSRRSKNVVVIINGRSYKRLDCVGRGGSSRVYRIMAENYKIFALKRVALEDADMASIAGYKGEIDLLRKLENVERVIRLYDYEVNEEKQTLNVMMELGESDFNKMLNDQIKCEGAKLDVSFTRYYWKEMLECVQAVHHHGIVHSDLKPANFLLVKGQLKLIDFGIANAIQDNTVNVHRENQIGTPNYMSPESLVCHTPAVGGAGGAKLLKLGRPSDVWSLGCILYQMTYGQPPFAHITKQFERIMSIPNPKVEIEFPPTGVGGGVVPFGLIKTLRKCLQRDQTLRPTIQELLHDTDPFLNPVAISPDMLGRMISNVIAHCRKKEDEAKASGKLAGESVLPTEADMRAWPMAFYDKLRQAQEEGTAW
jgi:serine/threonine-protein kinase TTK/MPS1